MTQQISSRQISADQWNRTVLARQHLLARVDEDAIEVIDRLVGLQAQDPITPFLALHARVGGFDPTELDELLTQREVVRIALLRATIFLVDGHDARWLRPLAQPSFAAEAALHTRRLVGADPAQIVADAAELLGGGELTGKELGDLLAERHPGEKPATLTALARCGLPLVQVPPRGLWAAGAAPTYRLLDDWLELETSGPDERIEAPDADEEEALRELVRLYLRGFGPASIKGIQTWAGRTKMGPLVRQMEADWELNRLTGPDGEELYDLDGLPLADPNQPAPVRLLAPFDHLLVAAADRQRICSEEYFRATVTPNGRSPGFVLIDGRLAGTWSLTGRRTVDARVEVSLFDDIAARARAELDVEVERLTAWCR